MTKLAIFDVDGTLFDGNLGIEFVKKLVSDKVFTEDVGNEIFSWYKKYKSGEVEKAIAVDACYENYNIGLKNHSINEIQNTAIQTWELVKESTFPFTKELIDIVKNQGYLVVLLSGSPIEMLSLFGKEYGIEETNIIAGISENEEETYTGKSLFYPGSSEQKIWAINKYISDNALDIDWKASIAMGDNERDAGILKLVGYSFAINPNDKLQEIAEENQYHIVSEDNVLEMILKVIAKSSHNHPGTKL